MFPKTKYRRMNRRSIFKMNPRHPPILPRRLYPSRFQRTCRKRFPQNRLGKKNYRYSTCRDWISNRNHSQPGCRRFPRVPVFRWDRILMPLSIIPRRILQKTVYSHSRSQNRQISQIHHPPQICRQSSPISYRLPRNALRKIPLATRLSRKREKRPKNRRR